MSNGKISVSSRERYRPKAIVRARLFKEGCKNSLASSTVTIDEDEGVQVFQEIQEASQLPSKRYPPPTLPANQAGKSRRNFEHLRLCQGL
jgi:hypothetical protein